jgi:hypothetical protein
MEDTVGCSAPSSARENQAAKLIFGSAEFWRFDALRRIRSGNDIFWLADVEVKPKIELQPPRGEDPGDMEDTVGNSAPSSARENEAAKLIFDSAEFRRFDVLGSIA